MRRRILISNNADDKYLRQYLTLRATESGKFSFSTNGSSPTTYYSLDSGYTWNEFHSALSNVQYTPTIPIGGTVMWKASGLTSSMSYGSGSFISTGNFTVEGNLQSMLWQDEFYTNEYAHVINGGQYALAYLFSGCTGLTSAENLQLPATVLRTGGYYCMFKGCVNLKYAPKLLPSVCLDSYCYGYMFSGCTSLLTAPEIEGKFVSDYGSADTRTSSGSCSGMFFGCKSLIEPPSKLSVKRLGYFSFGNMFNNCTSLITSPEFTVEEINGSSACIRMFSGCTSLTKVDAHLLSIYPYNGSYEQMFANCTSLTSVTEIAVATSGVGQTAYSKMFYNCSSLTHPQIASIGTSDIPFSNSSLNLDYMYYGCSALTEAPELPLEPRYFTYSHMFYNCKSLTRAPELPARTLDNGRGYSNMFCGCSNLNYVKCLATSRDSYYNTEFWLSGVASSGTFVKPSSMTSWGTGPSDIPSGWTIVNI